jgi:hypothetical protein
VNVAASVSLNIRKISVAAPSLEFFNSPSRHVTKHDLIGRDDYGRKLTT